MRQSRERLRSRFSEAAELYDRSRPTYPSNLVDDLVDIAALKAGSTVLEIGPGTGQLTVPLAQRRLRIAAVELGRDLANVASRNLAGFKSVEVHVSDFESWPLPPEPFDAVVAATSFHWIDPVVRYRKCAEALRFGGALVIVTTHHVAGGDKEFFEQVQTCYEQHMPGTPPGLRLPKPEEVDSGERVLESSGLFDPAEMREYVWEASYTTAEYLEVLMTYSGHRDLQEGRQQRLLECIATLIDYRFEGKVRKAYLNRLLVAKKR